MPSTYTTNNGVEQPAQGEQPNAWGNTLNTGMSLWDQSTDGVLALALTGSTASLPITQGAVSNGRNRVVIFTGTPGATCTVTVSPNTAQKLYFIRNNSNQTAIIAQGSGATVSIAAGASKAVYCNGAGVGAAVAEILDAATGTSPISVSATGVVSIQTASGSQPGALSAVDWTTFNSKQAALGYTPLNAASNLSDVASASTAKSNLGLGNVPNIDCTNGSNISSGTVAAARLGVMTGDGGSGGAKGAVPAPAAGDAAANKYLRADGTWTTPSVPVGSVAWGAITGTLSAQTDLNAALAAKEPTISAGTTAQYWRGDKTFQTLDKTAVGLSNVPNTDCTNATNISSGTLAAARYITMVGDSGSGGTKGAVPAPSSGDAAAGKFLKADGTWAVPASGGIKAVQRGSTTLSGIANSSATQNVTITSVTTTKAFVLAYADWDTSLTLPTRGEISFTAYLTNSTTLSLGLSSTGSGDIKITWEVVEFN